MLRVEIKRKDQPSCSPDQDYWPICSERANSNASSNWGSLWWSWNNTVLTDDASEQWPKPVMQTSKKKTWSDASKLVKWNRIRSYPFDGNIADRIDIANKLSHLIVLERDSSSHIEASGCQTRTLSLIRKELFNRSPPNMRMSFFYALFGGFNYLLSCLIFPCNCFLAPWQEEDWEWWPVQYSSATLSSVWNSFTLNMSVE